MAYSLSGTHITQSGTDNLEGLSDIVPNVVVGSKTFYDLSGFTLRVNGNMTIDPEVAEIAGTGTATTTGMVSMGPSGVINFGVESTMDDHTRRSTGTAMVLNTDAGDGETTFSFVVGRLGTLNWNGATLQTTASILFQEQSVVRVNEGEFIGVNNRPIVSWAEDARIDGLTSINAPVLFERNPELARNIRVIHSNAVAEDLPENRNSAAIIVVGRTPSSTNPFVVIENFESRGSPHDVAYESQGKVHLKNPIEVDPEVITRVINGGDQSKGYLKGTKDIEVFITDPTNTVVEGASCFIRDYNNNQRTNASSFFDDTTGIVDDTEDNVYSVTTDLFGRMNIDNILLYVNYNPDGTTENTTTDYRSLNATTAHIFIIHVWSYGLNYAAISASLVGEGRSEIREELTYHPDVTERDVSITMTYPELNSAIRVVNYISYWKPANPELPTISTTPITRVGNDIFSIYNIIFDPNSSALYIFDPATMTSTIRATVFTGNVTTTGTVTFLNGASVIGSVSSSDGITFRVLGFPANSGGVIGFWPMSDGINNQANITHMAVNGTVAELSLDANTSYYFIADAIGYNRSETILIESQDLEYTISLDRIDDGHGVPILPTTLDANQQAIADMFNYNASTRAVQITLPADFTTNSRWDATNGIWTFTAEDFVAIAYRFDEIQSQVDFFGETGSIIIEELSMTIPENSQFVLEQAPANLPAIINLNAFSLVRSNDIERKETYINNTNGPIHIISGPPIIVENAWTNAEREELIRNSREARAYNRDAAQILNA